MDNKSRKILQFFKTFEVMMKCPVCENKLSRNIYLCGSGHSVCNDCHDKGFQCRKCNAPYTKMQNLLLQDLILKYGDLEMSLNGLNKPEIQQSKSGKVPELTPPGISVNSNEGKLPRNKFRCLIAENCEFIGCLSGIIEHFEKIHPLEFQQHSNKNLPYKDSWQMNYFADNNLNRAFNIANNGLFILYISTNINKQLKACILMYARNLIANQHSYRIEIECGGNKLSYSGKVDSARTSRQIIFGSEHKCLLIEPNRPLYNALKDKIQFKCSIILKKDDLSTDIADKNCKINEGIINNQQLSLVNSQKTPGQANKSKAKVDTNTKSADLNKGGCKKKINQQKTNKSLNNDEKNQVKIIDKSLNKQLMGSKLNLYEPTHQFDGQNEQKRMQNELKSFNKPPEIIYQPLYNNYGQFPPQSNQIYHNYGQYGMNIPRPPVNFIPPPLGYDQMSYQSSANVYKPPQTTINCRYNDANIPSAPEVVCERPQPNNNNPHYQHQQMMNSSDNSMIREKSKDEIDKCVAF